MYSNYGNLFVQFFMQKPGMSWVLDQGDNIHNHLLLEQPYRIEHPKKALHNKLH